MSGPTQETSARPPGPAATSAGRLADRVHEDVAPSFAQAFPPATRYKVVVLAGLLVALHAHQLHWIVKRFADPNWTHGYLIPLFSLYLLYVRRNELLRTPRRANLLGLGILLGSLVGELLGVYPIRNLWVSQMFMVTLLLGLVLYLGGWKLTKLTALPILFLLFALPIPDTLYNKVALPLQNLSARGATGFLSAVGVSITGRASAMHLISRSGVEHDLTVAEACSGMRLLMAFLALGVAMAYLDDRPVWQRSIVVAMGIPIAVFCNVIRVIITSLAFYYDHAEWGQSFMHKFTGMLMLLPAFLMLWGLSWLLRRLVVEGPDAPPGGEPGSTEGTP